MFLGSRLVHGLTIVASVVFAAASLPAAEPPAAQRNTVNYGRPFEPATRPALIPLPPGAVEPAGWLRDWCLAARAGFTGHMDEYDVEFRRAWAADRCITGKQLSWPQGAWPWGEQLVRRSGSPGLCAA